MLTPPIGSILDFFEFQTLFYIAPRVPYGPQIWNLDFFEKFRPPPSVFKSPNLNFRLTFFFYPPPSFRKSPKFSVFLIMMPPLRNFLDSPLKVLWTAIWSSLKMQQKIFVFGTARYIFSGFEIMLLSSNATLSLKNWIKEMISL